MTDETPHITLGDDSYDVEFSLNDFGGGGAAVIKSAPFSITVPPEFRSQHQGLVLPPEWFFVHQEGDDWVVWRPRVPMTLEVLEDLFRENFEALLNRKWRALKQE